ncbi:unnamed protein product, partial [Adineta ricciae]
VLACQSPVQSGSDITKYIHDELVNDMKTDQTVKKRYTLILNPDCRHVGFGLVRNEEKAKDFVVIYYYPIYKSEE